MKVSGHPGVGLGLALALAVACSEAADNAYETRGLVAYYSFEEGQGQTVKDRSGKGNDGRVFGAKYVRVPGGEGLALRFDTPEAYVNCGNRPSLDLTEALTLELWLYPETVNEKGEPGLVGKAVNTYTMGFTGGGGWLHLQFDQGRSFLGTGTAAVKKWTHLVTTFDGRYLKTYTDGELSRESESPYHTIVHGGDFYLRYPLVAGTKVEPPFKCIMDDVRVYNRALSEEEVLRHYRGSAREKGHDFSAFVQVDLTPHVVTASRVLVVEADFSRMQPDPGSVLIFELRNTASGKVLATHKVSDLPISGIVEWTADTKDLPPGDYDVHATIMNAEGQKVGVPSSADISISHERPAWIAGYDNTKKLNNMVTELLNLQTHQEEVDKEYSFTNPRDGWVFVCSTGATRGPDRIFISIDSAMEDDAVITHNKEQDETLEAMRYLPAGTYKVRVRCEGTARLKALVVRAIPALIYNELGYNNDVSWLPCYGPYDWEFLERTKVLDNVNVILQRAPRAENTPHLEDWRRQGKKLLCYCTAKWLYDTHDPFTSKAAAADLDGLKFAGIQHSISLGAPNTEHLARIDYGASQTLYR